ncbi:hypothetical protein WMZ97_19760 [Lentibacillus sp. N15]|uniref:hypothetical protein n=1 Tax=Lentibacillus songyuanensis TaxID=3136161 RepID=UPI0031BA7B72
MNHKYVMKLVYALILMLPLLFVLEASEPGTASAEDADHQSIQTEINTENGQSTELTKDMVKEKTRQFMEILVQDIDQNNKVKHVTSKKELIQSFNNIASYEIAKTFVDTYYEERDDGLYVIPTETPAWVDENNNLHMVQLEDNQVKAVQHNHSDLHGWYTIEVEFTYDSDWIITGVSYSE